MAIPATAASSSNTVSLTVSQASQTITFGALSNQALGTQPFALSATASSNLAVFFTSTALPVCTVSGVTVTLLAGGSCTIQATAGRQRQLRRSAPLSQHFLVTLGNQTIAFGVLPDQQLGTAPGFPVNATASSGLSVAFVSTTLPVCTLSGAIVTLASGGACAIQASQAGDGNYTAAPSVNRAIHGHARHPDHHTFGSLPDQ